MDTTMMTLDDFAKAVKKPRQVKKVELEGGKHLWVRELTGLERDGLESIIFDEQRKAKKAGRKPRFRFRSTLVVWCASDEAGRMIYEGDDQELIRAAIKLGDSGSTFLDPIFGAAQEINGITQEELDELEGNSETGPSGSSPTTSPSKPAPSTSKAFSPASAPGSGPAGKSTPTSSPSGPDTGTGSSAN